MTLQFLRLLAVASLAVTAYWVGLQEGRRHGYQQCLGEQDDPPRARVAKGQPTKPGALR